ncbi:putative TIM-barrel fold metal-dependent hydrolase [Kribbella rubisoli]|uniref:TIM-barrel fold metal-dependent hydrolase n=1 Tax=Kribbella rubisoli TaxID=3075929 RepID=A0A4Q7WN27_9ACTN|nr:amidohydrolase family protein [Kribbella rubisoli]RZU11420.1 putative TIM-barrel fold metal-dependent hydrolase [Kribbella rubisoli]
MIVDAHCHAWRSWPYDWQVPDPATRGSVEALLYELDRAEVDRAVIVSACIGAGDPRTDNLDNNEFVADAVAEHPDRLVQLADVDSFWSDTHHTAGAAARLTDVITRTGAVGVTHYSTGADDGWFDSPDGVEFFGRAAELGLIASLHTPPEWQPAIGRLARRYPALPILVHHQGHVPTAPDRLAEQLPLLLANAAYPNVIMKLSGFHYVVDPPYDYPYPTAMATLQQVYAAYGGDRFVWGSDFPVARRHLTYRQSLEVVRRHCPFLGDDLHAILGGTMQRLLEAAAAPARK